MTSRTEAGAAVQPPSVAAPLLSMRGVSKRFPVRTSNNPFRAPRPLAAVDNVDLTIERGETFGLVGESGSGKSTLGRLAVRLTKPSEGSIHFDGHDISTIEGAPLRDARRHMQVVFQDPMGSLDPRMRIGDIIGEPLRVFDRIRGSELDDRVEALMLSVGLDTQRSRTRPISLSGGQRQRVGIARALALGPQFLLADEAVSALDVSVQAQIANLLVDLRERLGLTYLFIGHGLPIVRQLAHRVGVMYLGRIVETAPVDALFESPRHPYTQALIAASPAADPTASRQRTVLRGEPDSPLALPTGCRFRRRCPIAQDVCAQIAPVRVEVAPGHSVECHFAEQSSASR